MDLFLIRAIESRVQALHSARYRFDVEDKQALRVELVKLFGLVTSLLLVVVEATQGLVFVGNGKNLVFPITVPIEWD